MFEEETCSGSINHVNTSLIFILSSVPRGWLVYIFGRQFVFMACLFLSFQIRVHSSLPNFGEHFWGALMSTLAHRFIHRLMASRSILFRSWRICCNLVIQNLEVSGTSSFLWWSFHTTTKTTTRLVFKWTYLRPYMVGVVALHSVGLSLQSLCRIILIFFRMPYIR